MRRHNTSSGVVLGCAGVLSWLVAVAQTAPVQPARTIIITEVMYNPNSAENAGETEWIEIANVSSEAVELREWRIDDEDKKDWSRFTCTLQPGEIAVLINADKVSEADFRAAWDGEAEVTSGSGQVGATTAPAAPGDSVAPPPNAPVRVYKVIGVKWGGIANSPSAENEILQLLNGEDKVVCEVNLQERNGWPSCKKPDGPSIFLADPSAADLNEGKNWRRSAEGTGGARVNTKTEVFAGHDVGSPGFVDRLSAAVGTGAPATPAASTSDERAPGTIDY